MTATAHQHSPSRRPLLGLRRRPGRLALVVMRAPRSLYRHGWGWMAGHTFLLIAHQGRKTGKRHETVVMTLGYDRQTGEVIVCSAWGRNTGWIRNLRAHPALQIQIGRRSYAPEQRFLSESESIVVVREFERVHPWRLRVIAAILGWGDLTSEPAIREFVRTRSFVAFRPASTSCSGRRDR